MVHRFKECVSSTLAVGGWWVYWNAARTEDGGMQRDRRAGRVKDQQDPRGTQWIIVHPSEGHISRMADCNLGQMPDVFELGESHTIKTDHKQHI